MIHGSPLFGTQELPPLVTANFFFSVFSFCLSFLCFHLSVLGGRFSFLRSSQLTNMAEISKLDFNSDSLNHSREMSELQQMGKQQILVSDHRNVKSDSFVVNLEGFSNGVDKDSTTNSRITLQRSLSRKSQANGRDTHVCSSSSSSSSLPRTALAAASDTPEKPASPLPGVATIGATDNSINVLPQHQITIKTAGIGAMGETRWGKRHGIRRSPPSWFYNPKKILFLFATLSSVGTMLLIFFTLSMSRPTEST